MKSRAILASQYVLAYNRVQTYWDAVRVMDSKCSVTMNWYYELRMAWHSLPSPSTLHCVQDDGLHLAACKLIKFAQVLYALEDIVTTAPAITYNPDPMFDECETLGELL